MVEHRPGVSKEPGTPKGLVVSKVLLRKRVHAILSRFHYKCGTKLKEACFIFFSRSVDLRQRRGGSRSVRLSEHGVVHRRGYNVEERVDSSRPVWFDVRPAVGDCEGNDSVDNGHPLRQRLFQHYGGMLEEEGWKNSLDEKMEKVVFVCGNL